MTLTSRNNTLWITFYHQSRRVRKSLKLDDTKANRKLATTKIIPELLYKINSGAFFENEEKEKDVTVDEFAKISFAMHKSERKELTQKRYEQIYNCYIRPHFGNKKIANIKTSSLAVWQSNLLEKLAPKTVKLARGVLNTILEDAYVDDIINKNPFGKVKAPRMYEVREKKPFNVEEIYKILDHIPENIRAFFAIGFFTGMRTGEIIALKWENISFEERTIKVRKSIRQGIETDPKTKSSIRDIDILECLMPYLITHKGQAEDTSSYVFLSNRNQPYTTCAKIGVWYWQKTLKELHIEYRNLYQMRHTFASLMISNGEDILWVSQMLGHKDSSTTLEKYARYIKNKAKKRGTFLER